MACILVQGTAEDLMRLLFLSLKVSNLLASSLLVSNLSLLVSSLNLLVASRILVTLSLTRRVDFFVVLEGLMCSLNYYSFFFFFFFIGSLYLKITSHIFVYTANLLLEASYIFIQTPLYPSFLYLLS